MGASDFVGSVPRDSGPEDRLGLVGQPGPGVEQVDLAAAGAGQGQIAEPAAEPDGRKGRLEQASRVDRLIDLAGEFSEVVAVDEPAALRGVQHRDPTVDDVPDGHEEPPGKVDAEDVESDPLGHGAERQTAGHRQAGDALQDEIEVHGVGMGHHFAAPAEAEILEDRVVEVGEDAVHAAGAGDATPARQMGHLTADPMGDALQTAVGDVRIEVGAAVRTEGQDRVHEVAVAVKVGESGSVTVGPVDHRS